MADKRILSPDLFASLSFCQSEKSVRGGLRAEYGSLVREGFVEFMEGDWNWASMSEEKQGRGVKKIDWGVGVDMFLLGSVQPLTSADLSPATGP